MSDSESAIQVAGLRSFLVRVSCLHFAHPMVEAGLACAPLFETPIIEMHLYTQTYGLLNTLEATR